ncbi:MAG: hypothetical protein Q9207_001176 [Kuettlingeria erythrocarpa]
MDADDEKKCLYSEVDIETAGLRKLMEETMAHVAPGTFNNAVNYVSPFFALVFNWDALDKATIASENDDEERKEAREDLDKLLKYVRSTSDLESYFKIRELSLANKTMEFKHLWTLFSPGARVYAPSFLNDIQMFECQGTTFMDKDGLKPKLVVYCAAYDWNGTVFQRYSYRFYISKYEGPRAINALACFPIEYYQNDKGEYDDAALRVGLVERGRKFVKLCTAKPEDLQCDYSGLVLTKNPGMTRLTTVDADDDSRSQRSFDDSGLPGTGRSIRIKERIIVDNFSYLHSSRNASMDPSQLPPLGDLTAVESTIWDCSCSACRNGPAQDWHHRSDKANAEKFGSSEERLLFCPPKVLGYVLAKKIWGQFRVKDAIPCVSDEKSTSLFETKLELDDRHKKLLKAFIDNHESARKQTSHSANKVTDIIEGKGRGLVILLHGPPGVGKTLTAETVALACGRPLLPVSIADIGMHPDKAEQNLVDIFADAGRWEAVLLIDEADVFLENRIESTDTSRNALVSVLLRVLEYYEGIIILTTNRITSLDVAVQSRIHLAIQYQDLKPDQKFKIFKNFLNKIGEDNIDNPYEMDVELKKICRRTPINGRQIRNVVSSAQALALAEKRKLGVEQLNTVYETTVDFLESLKDLTSSRRQVNEVGLNSL